MQNNKKIVLFINVVTACAFLLICFSLYNSPICFMDDQGVCTHEGKLTFFQLFGTDKFLFFRPVKNLLFYIFMLDKPWGLIYARIISFAISFCAYLSVKKLLIKLTNSELAGSIAGAFWLLAPTMLSTIAWFSCTNIMVMTLAGTSALLCYIKQKENSSKRILYLLLTCILLFINLVSYEGGIALIPMIFALDFFLYKNSLKDKKTWLNYIYMGITCILYLVVRSIASGGHRALSNDHFGAEVTNIQTSFTSAWFTIHHILLWLFPTNSQYIVGYYSWGDVPTYIIVFCWVTIAGAIIYALLQSKNRPLLSLGISWIFLGFLPMSNILAFKNGPYGDYYLNYASIGIVIIIAYAVKQIEKSSRKNHILYTVLACYMAYLYGTTLSWIPAWQSSIVMIEKTRTVFPKQTNMLYEEVKYYMKTGNKERAEQILNKVNATPQATREAEAYKLWMNGKYQEAFDFLENDEKLHSPASRWSLYFRGYLQGECLNNDTNAILFYKKAINYDTTCDRICMNAIDQLAITYARNGKIPDAIDLWEKLIPISDEPEEIQKKIDFLKKQMQH
jgi:tetratricopeptide (TPR) repeat protein